MHRPVLGLISICLTAPGVALGATLDVCDTCTYRSVPSAVADAEEGDTIRVHRGTWRGRVEVDKALVIESTDGPEVTTLEYTSTAGEAIVDATADLVLRGFSMSADHVRGLWATGADVVLEDMVFAGLELEGRSGAGVWLSCGSLTVRDSVFRDNRLVTGDEPLHGAHLWVSDARVDIEGSTFVGAAITPEWIGGGGSIYLAQSDARIRGGLFADNTAGDGVWHDGPSVPGMWSSYDRTTRGGAIHAIDTTLDVEGTTFARNAASHVGDIYFSSDGDDSLRVVRSTFHDSWGGDDFYLTTGSIRAQTAGGAVHIERSVFRGNGAGGNGIARIDARYASVITNRFCESWARTSDVLVVNGRDGVLAVGNVVAFNEPYADDDLDAGAIVEVHVEDGRAFWRNGIFYANVSGGEAPSAALFAGDSDRLDVVNNHFTGNAGVWSGGGRFHDTPLSFVNNAVAWNEGLAFPHGGNRGAYPGGLWVEDAPSLELAWSLWWENIGVSDGKRRIRHVYIDGERHIFDDTHVFAATHRTWDRRLCEIPIPDDFRAGPDDPTVNAGDPDIQDRNGSRSNIGAFGGPDEDVLHWTVEDPVYAEVRPTPEGHAWWVEGTAATTCDADADAFRDPEDCDDADADVGPEDCEHPLDGDPPDDDGGTDGDGDGDGDGQDTDDGDGDDEDTGDEPDDDDGGTGEDGGTGDGGDTGDDGGTGDGDDTGDDGGTGDGDDTDAPATGSTDVELAEAEGCGCATATPAGPLASLLVLVPFLLANRGRGRA